MQHMTPDEYRHFMLATARTGKIASVREDGRPHLAPIWFDMEGDLIYFTSWHTTVKAHNFQRDPRVSLCVDDHLPPFSFAIVEGTVEEVKVTPQERIVWATRIARRYMGDDKAEAYGKRNGVEGELIFCLTPNKVIAQANISD